MAGLHFDVTADNQNFIRRLREIEHGIENTSKQAQIEGKKMDSAFNSVSFGDTLKKQIHEGSQSVNGLTAQIIKQKAVIKDIEHDVRNLGGAYRKAGAGTAKGNALFADFKSAKASVQEEKAALFDLQTQQAQARLSVRKLKDEYSLYQKEGQNVIDSNNNMALSFKKTLAAIGGTAMIQKFVSDVIRVRGEFQQLDVAFTTLLQSKEKADALMGQIVQTAAKTPFNLTELATGAKQLVAYGFASEGVNDTLIRLGNIASGLGLPLERLTYLYGTTMTQGRLYARDMMQFTTSGIPMLQGLADMYGVSTAKVNEMVTAGKIGFPEVQKVIENMTNEGGKFFNLMEEQSKTITGRISNLGDAWDTMLNKIGESQEGVINDSIDGLKYLVENYEQVGRILIGVIELYGTYRAALLANAIIEQGFTKAIWGKVTATKAAAIAQTAFNKVLKGNIYVAIASAALSFGIAMWALADHTTTAEKAQKRFNDSLAAQKQRLDDAKKSAVELISTIKSETATHYDKMAAYLKLQGIMPEVFKNMDIEKLKLMDILSYNKLIAEEINRRERVGTKTSLVLKTNAYSEAKERYSKTSSRNSNILTYYAQMKAAEEDMKLAQKQVDDIEKIQSEANKQKGKEDKKVVVENKEFWDKQKKDAETALDTIDSKQRKLLNAGKFDGIDAAVVANYKSQSKLLEEAQKELKVYDTSGKSEKQQESAAEKLREQQEKYNLLMDKQSREQIRSTEDLWNEVWQAQIDTMDEGGKKTLAQMELNHEKELQAIDRQREDLLRKKKEQAEAVFNERENEKKTRNPNYVKQTFDGSGVTLDETENKQFDGKYKATLDKQAKDRQAYYAAEKQAMNEYLAAYGDYMQKRQAIIDQGEEKKKGKSQWEQKSVDEDTKKLLAGVDDEVQKKTSIITQLFSDMSKRTVADMRLIADQAQKTLDYVNAGEFKTDDSGKGLFGLTKEQFDILSKSPEKLESIKNEIANVRKEADASETALNKLGNGLKKVFSSGSDTKKFQEGLADISEGMNSVLQAGQFLSDSLSTLGDAFGSGTLSGIADGINVAMDAMSSTMDGAKAGAAFGPWGAAAGAAIGMVTSLASSFAKIHDAKNEKRITVLQDQVEVLEKSYDKLGNSIEKAYSKDASKLIDQQNTLLEQQKVLIRNQIAEERDKKKTDDGRIEEWERQIEDINKLIEDNKEKQIDAIFGEDLKSAINNFAQAYTDAWTSGEDKAKSAKDTVKNMMRQMVTESIKAAIQSSESMERIRAKLQEFYSDNVLSGWEQDYIYNMADSLQQELDNKFGWADGLIKDEDPTREASKKGIATASQDSVDENNGRLTVMQSHTYSINEGVISIKGSTEKIATSLACLTNIDKRMSDMIKGNDAVVGHLSKIEGYTANLVEMRESMYAIKIGIDTLNTKGLTLKR